MSDLGRRPVVRKRGDEALHEAGKPVGVALLDFWRWTGSDLLSNALRGTLAEFIVACDLGVALGTRVEWDAADLRTQDSRRIEVKSAAYLQTWDQQRLSAIKFDIEPKFGWNADTNEVATERSRSSDAYVFALLHHEAKASVDPLDVSQWTFYVLPTAVLDTHVPAQKQITLGALLRLGPTAARFGEINSVLHLLLA